MKLTQRIIQFALAGLVVVATAGGLLAQRPDPPTAHLFPTPPTVLNDFPDDPHRWAALMTLYAAAQEKSPDGQYKASYQQSSDYLKFIQIVEERHRHPQEDKAFFDAIEKLRTDRAFRTGVLQRYKLAGLPTMAAPPPRSTTAPQVAKSGETLVQEAAPWWLVTIVAMWLVSRPIIRASGNVPVTLPPAPVGVVSLPDSLRLVEVPAGRKYLLEMDSRLIIEEQSWSETRVSTFTTPGSVQTIGDQTYVTNPQSHTDVSTVRMEKLWLKDTEGRESAWTLAGGVLDARAGHIISRIGGRWGDQMQYIMAINHTTGQAVLLHGGVRVPHGTPGGGAYSLSVLIGIVGWMWAGWPMVPLLNPESPVIFNAIGFGIIGLIGSAIIAMIVGQRISRNVMNERDKAFREKYVPALKKFLEDSTPNVIAQFSGVRAAH